MGNVKEQFTALLDELNQIGIIVCSVCHRILTDRDMINLCEDCKDIFHAACAEEHFDERHGLALWVLEIDSQGKLSFI